MSKKGFEVRNTFDTLFCDVELLPSAEKTLESINFDDLAQVLRHDAKAVYAYATWTKNKTGCEYRGELLFPFPATLLQSAPYMIAGTESGICDASITVPFRRSFLTHMPSTVSSTSAPKERSTCRTARSPWAESGSNPLTRIPSELNAPMQRKKVAEE